MTNETPSVLAAFCAQIIALKRLPRTGWLQRGIAHPESIAEHTCGVALLALAVAPLLPGIDRERTLALALIHDLGEAILTDLPLSASRLLGAAKHQAEQRAVAQVVGALPGGEALMADWREYHQAASPEARLVKALDRIELLAQALAYEQAGQRGLDEFWVLAEQGWDEFPPLAELARELAARRPRI